MSPRSPDNPWAGLAQSPPEPSNSFSEILRDEIKKTDVLTKTANKSLELIQVCTCTHLNPKSYEKILHLE